MYKIVLLATGLALVHGIANAQSAYPDGIYLTYEQLKAGTPGTAADLRVKERSGGDIAMVGGNDYKLLSDGDTLEKKYLKREVYAYVQHDSLFLNCFPHQLGLWYALVLNRGNFLAFRTALTAEEAMAYGVMGGAIGGAVAAGMRRLHVLSMRTGNVRSLSPEYLTARFTENGLTDLQQAYAKEPKQKDEDTLLRYVDLLNAAIAKTPAP